MRPNIYMHRKILLLLVVLIFTRTAFPQTVPDAKKTEDAAKLEKEAVEFLRETSADVNNMRSSENRISFNSELASLMWFHDEKEAKAMYAIVISEFKRLVMQYDVQMNSPALPTDDDTYGGIFGGDRYGRTPVERKFRVALAVRQQIAMSLAEHDPDNAFNFYDDCINLISNPELKKETEASDKNFELQLIKRIAETNAAKASQYGKATLKNGFSQEHVELLHKIYAKDQDKAIEFGAAILSTIKSDKPKIDNLYVYFSLLSFASENFDASKKGDGKKAIYSQSDLRDMAELFGQTILENNEAGFSGVGYAELIGKYAPSRAAQIRAKFRSSTLRGNTSSNMAASASNANGAAVEMSRINGETTNVQAVADEAREKISRQMMGDVLSLGTKTLSKEERETIVAQSRKIISQTPGKEKKLMGLSFLAARVNRAGDKELAAEIMKDAASLVNPQPKNYQDFIFIAMLASGYAEADPDKAFPLLDDTIGRINETLNAFVKVAEFIDTNQEMIDDGEVQVGAFGGSMVSGLTSELGIAAPTIRSLVKADFAKTRGLTNRFERPEIRILAKMMVLRAILDGKTEPATDDAAMIELMMTTQSAPPKPTTGRRPH